MSDLGELLRKLRGQQSLREISRHTGFSYTYLQTIERGFDAGTNKPIVPTLATLKELSRLYNYSFPLLVKAAGYGDDASIMPAVLSDAQQHELDQLIQRADQEFVSKGVLLEDRQRIIDMLIDLFYDSLDENKQSN